MGVASLQAVKRIHRAYTIHCLRLSIPVWSRAGFLSPVMILNRPHVTASWIVPIQR